MAVLDLTTAARVKAYVTAWGEKGWDGTTFDAMLAQLITSASAAIARHLRRETLKAERTQDFTIQNGQRVVWLPAYPVDAAATTTVKVDSARAFGSDTAVVAADFAILDRIGGIEFDGYVPVPGPGVCRVTWTGGLATTPALLIADWPDIAQAAELTVHNLIQRRLALGGSLQGGGQGGSATYVDAIKILPEVERLLEPYVRRRHG